MNQTVVSTFLIAAAACSCAFTQACANPAVVATLPADMLKSRQWTAQFLTSPGQLPIAFKLDGSRVAGIPDDWKPVTRKRRMDANLIETIFEGSNAASGLSLRVECLEYLDYPVVEWVAWFTNAGTQATPIISDILALDGVFEGGAPVLWHCNGDFYSGDGYTAQEAPVREGQPLRFGPQGGRPCDHAFPYYRLMFQGCGLSLAIGWPGQWSVVFQAATGGVRVSAAQEKTHLRLMPGETIRTPRITVMSWVGEQQRGANLWRHFYRDHLLPRPNGRPLGPRLVGHGTDDGEEFTAATEENQVRYIKKWAERGIPIDVWWIDAGWYPCYNATEQQRRWWETGTWVPDAARFPHGLKPVSDCAARHGADLLIWFEPERVRPGSQLDREHPEWLLKAKGATNHLLNLGNSSARQWLTDHICRLICDNAIKVYRQDFNFEPLNHWRENDAPDRQGMSENHHIQGYLQYWDDLLARNPGLWIDSCSSGGRRNDLETMRRAVPLHYTDFGYGNHPVKLSFHHVLFEWLPYFKEVTLSWDLQGQARYDQQVDSFSYHCGLGPMLIPCIDIRRDDYDFGLIQRMVGIWRRAADLMIAGDYYPLTPLHRTPDKWVARQFDCPVKGQGFIQAIRLPAAPEANLVVHPQGLVADAVYHFHSPETGETRVGTGRTVHENGFAFELQPRQAALWFYRAEEPNP